GARGEPDDQHDCERGRPAARRAVDHGDSFAGATRCCGRGSLGSLAGTGRSFAGKGRSFPGTVAGPGAAGISRLGATGASVGWLAALAATRASAAAWFAAWVASLPNRVAPWKSAWAGTSRALW